MFPIHRVALVAFLAACCAVCCADYPIFWQRYTADPSALVWDGRLYLFCSHDTYDAERGYGYFMNDVTCLSTTDMKNWTDHGEVFSYAQCAWGATQVWAPQVVERDGRFYLYYGNADRAIGVAVADNPLGPYRDTGTRPLVDGSTPGVLIYDSAGEVLHPRSDTPGAIPGSEDWNVWVFDPSVLVDPATGRAYLFFGGGHPDYSRIIPLAEDMVSTEGRAIHPNTPGFFEGSWGHTRQGLYYYSYAGHGYGFPANIEYVVSDNPMWGYGQPRVLLPNPPDNDGLNNHHSVVEYRGRWYVAYHNRKVVHEQMLAAERGVAWCAAIDGVADHRAHEYMRSVCIDRLFYNADGSMATVVPTEDGLEQIAFVDPSLRQEGEMMAKGWGIDVVNVPNGTNPVSSNTARATLSRHEGDYVLVRGVDFSQGQAANLTAAIGGETGDIEMRLNSVEGPLLATLTVDAAEMHTVSYTMSQAVPSGIQNLCFVFKAPGLLLDWWQFAAAH